MLRALIEDILRIPGMQVVTTWDRRLTIPLGIEPSSSLRIVPVADPDEEWIAFRQLCEESDGSYIIAPELNDELSRRISVAHSAHKRRPNPNLNCSLESIDLCGDKWALFEHLTRHAIPTIPTYSLGVSQTLNEIGWPRVLKLRLGAGSQSMQLVTSPEEWVSAISRFDHSSRQSEAIIQPFIPGVALSVGVIVDRNQTVHRLPVADQFIDPHHGFAYLGGRIPSSRWSGPVDQLIEAALRTIPGLYGYVGIDLLIPDGASDSPLLVEINPRLTTSYTGYRRLCRDNLAALWLSETVGGESLRWHAGYVEFNSAGECS